VNHVVGISFVQPVVSGLVKPVSSSGILNVVHDGLSNVQGVVVVVGVSHHSEPISSSISWSNSKSTISSSQKFHNINSDLSHSASAILE